MIIDELETRIGSRWLLYVGVVAIIVGVGYFEKLAIDNGWISEAARVIQGGVAGLLLIAAGLRFVRKGYSLYGQILCGAGIAILYVSTYAAFNFYLLLSQPLAFAAMSAITMLAAWLANRQRSQQLALVAVGGGFATPFLLPATIDAQAALFGYDAILIAGTMFLSRRRDWPMLNVVSYAATVLTIFAWAADFYTPAKYLTTEMFLTLYCAMFLYILGGPVRSERPAAKAERAVLATAPVGYYVLSLVILAGHSTALLIYLVLLSLVGVLVSTRFGSSARFGFRSSAAVERRQPRMACWGRRGLDGHLDVQFTRCLRSDRMEASPVSFHRCRAAASQHTDRVRGRVPAHRPRLPGGLRSSRRGTRPAAWRNRRPAHESFPRRSTAFLGARLYAVDDRHRCAI
jgi:hypothetical protein